MHADSASSGVSPWPGPGLGTDTVTTQTLLAACPTIVQGTDGMPVALCTKIVGEKPVVYLLNPATGAPLTSLALGSAGNLFGGVYTYIDQDNRLVMFDSNGDLIRIAHSESGGRWSLQIASTVPSGTVIGKLCADVCGGVVGIAPDWKGNVWFATTDGVVGYVTPAGDTMTIRLGTDEKVANSISTVPGATAIATDHALYLMNIKNGRPHIIWRSAYDRGPARKPGQLSWGTGSTPVFFGPQDGTRYLTFLDNAAPAEHLVVLDTWKLRHERHTFATKPRVACELPVLNPGPSGSENAPVASGDSVFVASTYGYAYPASPSGEPDPDPKMAPFTGGVTRVDLNANGRGCHVVWQDGVRSAAVPRLDATDGILYTAQDTDPLSATATSVFDTYSLVAIDAGDGDVIDSNTLGTGYQSNTLQLSPTIVPGGVMYQGTVTGIDRIGP